jgi:hypothetical protein
MANKNIPLLIAVPNRGVASVLKVAGYRAKDSGDYLRIPRRYPFADITAPTGYFRHNVLQNGTNAVETAISAELSPVAAGANALNTLGFELPPTEKLILLISKGPALNTAATVVIKGSLEYKQDDITIDLPSTDAAGTIYEVDVTSFGLLIGRKTGVVPAEDGIIVTPGDTSTGLLLIARVA